MHCKLQMTDCILEWFKQYYLLHVPDVHLILLANTQEVKSNVTNIQQYSVQSKEKF